MKLIVSAMMLVLAFAPMAASAQMQSQPDNINVFDGAKVAAVELPQLTPVHGFYQRAITGRVVGLQKTPINGSAYANAKIAAIPLPKPEKLTFKHRS